MKADPRAALGARLCADARLREAAGTFLRAAADRGVQVAPIKGLVVSALLYDDPLERPFGDVDVLVGRSDLGALEAIAARCGWRIVRDSRQLLTLNAVIPPGIPIDVRASVGPPLFSTVSACEMLERSTGVTDPRVVTGRFQLLAGHDHLTLLMLDAVFDKLSVRSEQRKKDLSRAIRRWVATPEGFAAHARRAGLSAVAWMALSWLHDETGDPIAAGLLEALGPIPPIPRAIAGRVLGAFRRSPYGPVARLGARLLADSPVRALGALALGAVGTARYHLRHRGRNPWDGVLWRGPSAGAGAGTGAGAHGAR